MNLEKELKVYEAKLQGLEEREGEYVVIQGEEIVDVYTSYEDALKAAFEKFGVDSPFLVKQIQNAEHVHQFTREIPPACHP